MNLAAPWLTYALTAAILIAVAACTYTKSNSLYFKPQEMRVIYRLVLVHTISRTTVYKQDERYTNANVYNKFIVMIFISVKTP